MMSGISIAGACLGIGSIMGSISNDSLTITLDNNSSPLSSIFINVFFVLGVLSFLVGSLIELYERLVGEAAVSNRAKSIDLRSLGQASAPKLSRAFPLQIEESGLHYDLFLCRLEGENLDSWLERSKRALEVFSSESLERINSHESEHPLALGAQAHIPHCFTIGFMVANRRLVNFYCWSRDKNKDEKSRWIDTRDKRTRGKTIIGFTKTLIAQHIDDDTNVKKLGLSLEISIPSNPTIFMTQLKLDACTQIKVKHQYVGNLFSEKEQVNIITEIRSLLNNNLFKRFPNLRELHITITGQASFVMRLGADFNQNHFPKVIKVYHFENNTYPWCFCLSPNNKSIQYLITRDQ
ncbi:SAVED domain-containing protein [Salinivibrio sp. ES.052]|uniref:SAVED domain-containing protein n=1 Tax=Salinivibrio sp. ES.052 TaxID=1882823 RepID=UPI0009419EBA|nr:SAVED domain-containing protein [Salinivibrio sp. ES.052]